MVLRGCINNEFPYIHIPSLNDVISDNTKQKIVDTVKKIMNFIWENKSYIFFGLTIAFAYYMAPTSAFEYMNYWGASLTEAVFKGVVYGAGILTLRNIFSPKQISKNQDDKINYLLGIINVAETLLSPTYGVITAFTTGGGVAIKMVTNLLTKPDDPTVIIAVEMPQK